MKIIITDNNQHIKMLLLREIKKLSCTVFLQNNPQELLKKDFNESRPDLIIIDPDSASMELSLFLKKIQQKFPESIIIVHGYEEFREKISTNRNIHFIEKNGSSIGNVKKFIRDRIKV